MKQSTGTFLRIGLPMYAVAFNGSIQFVLSISMAGLISAFPGVRESVLMYLLTITTLMGIVGGFVLSSLVRRFSMKTLTLAGLTAGCVSALAYLLFPTMLPVLFFASGGLGFSGGFVSTAFSLLVNIHVDEENRGRVLGFGSGTMQFGRLAALFLGGFLANIRWNYVLFTYAFMLIAFLLTAFLLPQDTPAGKEHSSGQKTAIIKLVKSLGVWQLMTITLLYGGIYFLTNSHISLYIEGYGLGLPSITGTLSAVSCGLAGVVGFMFAPIYRALKKHILWVIFFVTGAGFIIAGIIISLPSIFLGIALCTVGIALFLPYFLLCISRNSDRETTPLVIAMMPVFMNIGSFMSPGIINFLVGTFSSGGAAYAYLYGGIFSVVMAFSVLVAKRWLIWAL